jgi:hypothetical protein
MSIFQQVKISMCCAAGKDIYVLCLVGTLLLSVVHAAPKVRCREENFRLTVSSVLMSIMYLCLLPVSVISNRIDRHALVMVHQ